MVATANHYIVPSNWIWNKSCNNVFQFIVKFLKYYPMITIRQKQSLDLSTLVPVQHPVEIGVYTRVLDKGFTRLTAFPTKLFHMPKHGIGLWKVFDRRLWTTCQAKRHPFYNIFLIEHIRWLNLFNLFRFLLFKTKICVKLKCI